MPLGGAVLLDARVRTRLDGARLEQRAKLVSIDVGLVIEAPFVGGQPALPNVPVKADPMNLQLRCGLLKRNELSQGVPPCDRFRDGQPLADCG